MLEITPNNVSIVHCISLILFSSAYSGADPTITSGESIQVKKIIIVDNDTKQNSKSVTYMTVDIKSLTHYVTTMIRYRYYIDTKPTPLSVTC